MHTQPSQPPVPPPIQPPPVRPAAASPDRDERDLRLLSTFHYVLAAALGVLGCLPLVHVGLGLVMLFYPEALDGADQPPLRFIGGIFLVLGAAFAVFSWTTVALLIVAAQRLRRRTRWTFCFVVGAISCLFQPLGTVLGVFTIIVLSRPSVKALFESGEAESCDAPG
jgi:hypothetical protein